MAREIFGDDVNHFCCDDEHPMEFILNDVCNLHATLDPAIDGYPVTIREDFRLAVQLFFAWRGENMKDPEAGIYGPTVMDLSWLAMEMVDYDPPAWMPDQVRMRRYDDNGLYVPMLAPGLYMGVEKRPIYKPELHLPLSHVPLYIRIKPSFVERDRTFGLCITLAPFATTQLNEEQQAKADECANKFDEHYAGYFDRLNIYRAERAAEAEAEAKAE